MTLFRCDWLTLNAPYPSCHANLEPTSFNHLEVFPLISCTAFANVTVGGNEISK